MSDENLPSNRPSVISFNELESYSHSYLHSRESENEVERLRNQIRALENENIALKRSLPRLQDVNGRDITDEIKNYLDQLSKMEQNAEYWESECAAKEQLLTRQRQEFNHQMELKDYEIQSINDRAKALEDENLKLREELENENSRMFRLANNESNLMHDFQENDLFLKLKQDLDEKIAENYELQSIITNLNDQIGIKKQKLAEQEKIINQQTRAVEAMLGQNAQEMLLNMSMDNGNEYSTGDYIASHMYVLLELLNKNWHEMKDIRQRIIEFLRENSFEVNEEHVNILSETFNLEYSKRRDEIKKKNVSLQKKLLNDGDSELKRHLDVLNDDSLASRPSFFVQPNTFSMSFADIIKNTTNADIFNKTAEVTQDLNCLMNQMTALRNVCSDLFKKLRGTAEFLERVLETLGETEEGQELVNKIMDLKFDLDKSVHEALNINEKIQRTEKSMADFCDFINQTFELPPDNENVSVAYIESPWETNQKFENIDYAAKEKSYLNKLKELQDQFKLKENDLQKIEEHLKIVEEENLELKKETEVLNEKYLLMIQSDSEQKKELEKIKEDLKEKAIEIVKFEFAIEELKMEIKNKKQQIDDQKNFINEQTNEIEKISDQNLQKEEKISELYQELNEVNNNLNDVTRQNVDLDKVNQNLRKLMFDLEQKYNELSKKENANEEVLKKTNFILMEKINEGLSHLPNESFTEDNLKENQEDISNNEEFTKFMSKCHDHANKIVQILKKGDEIVKAAKVEGKILPVGIPYYDPLISNARIIRIMLFKISEYFKKQTSLNSTKLLGNEIRSELKKIYEILHEATETTSSIKKNKTNVALKK